MKASAVKKSLAKEAEPKRIFDLQWFFKTKKGEYAEGDKFIGVRVPNQRKVAKQYQLLPLTEIEQLLQSPIHEHRLTALFILLWQFKKADKSEQKRIVELYWRNTKYINNWDLVDSSAPRLIGAYYADKDRKILYQKARSKNLWERRISIIACAWFISRHEDFIDALKISEILLADEHDLIHKAVGWMLREVGNKDRKVEEDFLKKFANQMPRTMLRYAIEKFPEDKRKSYLKVEKR